LLFYVMVLPRYSVKKRLHCWNSQNNNYNYELYFGFSFQVFFSEFIISTNIYS